jgi:hypothetical protein
VAVLCSLEKDYVTDEGVMLWRMTDSNPISNPKKEADIEINLT